MEDLISYLVNASVATVWNEKIISTKELVLYCVLYRVDTVISASHTSKSSSELELYLSSVNRGADICDKLELEFCNLGRGMRGVNGLCDAVGTAGTQVSHILTVSDQGGVDWHLSGDVCTGICGWC